MKSGVNCLLTFSFLRIFSLLMLRVEPEVCGMLPPDCISSTGTFILNRCLCSGISIKILIPWAVLWQDRSGESLYM